MSLLLMFALFSCSKEKGVLTDHGDFLGECDWSYSVTMDTSAMLKQNSDYYFGIRIEPSGRLKLFENSELTKSGRVTRIYTEKNSKILYCEYRGQTLIFYKNLESGDIYSKEYPLSGFSNYFIKK